MNQADHYPLTAEHYEQINAGLRSLYDATQLIEKAKATGMDVRAHQEVATNLMHQLNAIKLQFFPKGPPK